MRSILTTVSFAAVALCCAMPGWAQEDKQGATATLARLTGPDEQPVQVDTIERRRRAGQADMTPHEGPYFRTATDSGSGTLWHVDGAECTKVTGVESKGNELGTELVRSGDESYLTRIREGANEFFRLDGAEARPVTFEDGEIFHERARITRGGDRAILYATTFEGELRLHEVTDGVARPIEVKDKRDHGAIMYAWDVGEIIVAGFYKEGGYSFRALRGGFFRSTLGDDDPTGDVSEIYAERFGDVLFLNVIRPADVSEHWVFDGEILKRITHENLRHLVRWSRPAIRAVGADGLYATALNKSGQHVIVRCDGESVERTRAGEDVLHGITLPTVYGQGGSVFVQTGSWGEYETWMLDSGTATLAHKQEGRRPEMCSWLAQLDDFALVQYTAGGTTVALGTWKNGAWLHERIGLQDPPADFGEITKAWNARGDSICILEWSGSEHRLWRLTLSD